MKIHAGRSWTSQQEIQNLCDRKKGQHLQLMTQLFFWLININTGSLTDINAVRKNEEEVEMVLERQMMLCSSNTSADVFTAICALSLSHPR